MIVGKAIYNLLVSNADLRAIVDTRIFPEVAQQDAALPYVVYNVSNNEPSDTKREPSKMDTAQIEVNLYSTSYTECIDMATHVRAALDRVTGTYSGVNVQSIQYLSEIIDFDEAQRTYNISADYDVRISRTDFEIAQGSPITGVTLGQLSDVDTTGVTDGQVIAYDAAAQEWQPADDAGGVTELGQLTDVQFGQGGPETGELLKYDGSEWTNDSIVKSEIGLGNVDNTSDANKPVSTATQTELNAKANSADFSNVDNTSDADKPISTATQTALNAKADTSAVPTDLNDLSDVTIVGTPAGNQALIYDATAGAFKSQVSYTNRFEDEVETGKDMPTIFAERAYSVKSEGDGIFIDPESDTPAAGKLIVRKIYHKTGFITDADVIGDYTLIHTFADDTAYADTVATFEGFEDGATYGVPPFTLLQTWEEISSVQYLLDKSYGSGAAAAYSTRQLRFAQTDCMVIRRASDSTTTTIGFDGSGNISEADIETFCTGTTCTVYQWLDQSGNGNTATAPSTGEEPTIYTGGALLKENGKLALDFDGGKVLTESIDWAPRSTFLLTKTNGAGGQQQNILRKGNSPSDRFIYRFNQAGSQYLSYDAGFSNLTYSSFIETKYLFNHTLNGGTKTLQVNGVLTGTTSGTLGTLTTDTLYIGKYSNESLNGIAQEILFYTSAKLGTDQTSIESNVGDYFTQNTPLLDTYSGAAAAYSLRLLDSTYTGSAIRVRRSSDNTEQDIGFNVFGELDTVSLTAFAGAGDAFVKTWYCQSGNSNDATQTATTKQPQIVSSGAVIVDNGKPALQFDGSVNGFTVSPIGAASSKFGFITHSVNSSDTAWSLLAATETTFVIPLGQSGSGAAGVFGYTMNNIYQDGSSVSPNTRGDIYNAYTSAGQSITTLDFSGDAVGVLFNRSGFEMQGKAQEVIIYASDQSANRTNIESNIATFYEITL